MSEHEYPNIEPNKVEKQTATHQQAFIQEEITFNDLQSSKKTCPDAILTKLI